MPHGLPLHYLDALRPVLRALSLGCLGAATLLTALATLGLTLPAHEPLLLTALVVGVHSVLGLCAMRARHGLGDWGQDVGLGVTLAGLYGGALAVLLTLFAAWTGWRPGPFGGSVLGFAHNLSAAAAALGLAYAIPVHNPRLVLLQKLTVAGWLSQLALCGVLLLLCARAPWLWRLDIALLILSVSGLAALRLATGPLPPDDAPPPDALPSRPPPPPPPPTYDGTFEDDEPPP